MHTLQLHNLSKRFGDTVAVHGVSLSIDAGSFVGVIGRSGAGKSTLLRMINRLNEPSSGTITFDDAVVTDLQGPALREWRRNCAMVFQQFNLIGRLDVLTNVMMGRLTSVPTWRSLLTLWSDADKLAALEALERFGMADFAAQRCDQLSGGQQQRVALCRAGITVLCNLHALDVARNYCDRLVGMSAGRVVFDDVPDALSESVVHDLYGMEAAEVQGRTPAVVLPFARHA